MNITILCVGKIKEKYFSGAINEYKKRLSAYAKIDIIEVPDEKTWDNMSEVEINLIKEKEAEKLLKHIKEGSYNIALAIEGTAFNSNELSLFINKNMTNGYSSFTFIIGGSLGLSKSIYNKSNQLISFSKMTFPHQLMRVILMEQIYRGFKIMKGEPYHK